jgi:hypothetical protein
MPPRATLEPLTVMYLDPWAMTGSEDNSFAADRFPAEL